MTRGCYAWTVLPKTLPLLRWLTLSFLALLCVLAVPSSARAAGALPPAGEYVVDARGSAVTFNVTNFVVSSVDGKFTAFDGKVVVGDSLATTTVEASVDIASIDTGIKQRDDHLRSGDYFDVAKHPRMTWKSSQLWGTADSFGMKGTLTIKGISKEVVFAGRISDAGVIVCDTKIDRQNFGLTAGPSIKNEVRLRLSIRMAKRGA